MIVNNIEKLIGNTPMLKLDFGKGYADVYLKLEMLNPGGSVKDRAALGMIEAAEAEGLLNPNSVIVEPTSGNTGIAIAMIGRLKGYKVKIVMPETMSKERRDLIQSYGAELILTDGTLGMKGAIDKSIELSEESKNVFIPYQFINDANPGKHYVTTAEEILNDVPDIDTLVVGVGTGGTIAGVGQKLKETSKDIQVVAVEPKNSPVLSGGKPGPHKIQGIGAGFIPKVYEENVVDRIITIGDEEAMEYVKEFRDAFGLLIGISASANVLAAKAVAKELGEGKKVVTVAPDGGAKYISTGIYF